MGRQKSSFSGLIFLNLVSENILPKIFAGLPLNTIYMLTQIYSETFQDHPVNIACCPYSFIWFLFPSQHTHKQGREGKWTYSYTN